MPLWGIFILILLVLLNGIFYGFAAAVQNLNENEIQKKALQGDKKSLKLMRLVARPYQYVNAIPIIITASGICFGIFLVPWMARVFHSYIKHVPALVIVTVICVILLASLGILTFRRVGSYYPDKYVYRFLNIIYFFVMILLPFTLLVTWIAKLAARLMGVDLHQAEEAMTEEEIISIVDEAHEQGVIEENEAEMIQNIISFNETEAHDIMTHRKNVVAFNEEDLLQEVIDVMLEEGNSRYPVYTEDIDNIIGVLHYKDALKFMTKNSWAKFKPLKELPGLIREAVLIPETRSISDLFRTMQTKKMHMVIVVDEYGQTSGIVSLEDILEEIVGDIQDEYDDDEADFRMQKDNTLIIDALADLEDVEEKLSVNFEEEDFETLNGYLTSILGHIPTEKDLDSEITAKGYRFKILSLGNKTIGKVRAEKI